MRNERRRRSTELLGVLRTGGVATAESEGLELWLQLVRCAPYTRMFLISETGTESYEGALLRRETGVRLCEASFDTETNRGETT